MEGVKTISHSVGLGFDPDCHFYNQGITVSVATAHAPIPSTAVILCSGVLALVGLRKKRKSA